MYLGDVENNLILKTTKRVTETDNTFSSRTSRFASDDAFYYPFWTLQGARKV